jgi:kinetochore protein Fta7
MVLNSIDLLNVEIDKEEDLLAKDTTQLEEMEKNAKRAEAERKRQMKNVCFAGIYNKGCD